MTWELSSPFVTLTWDRPPEHPLLILAGWLALWAVVVGILLYGYAVALPGVVGFETALLAGIGLLILSSGGGT